MLERYMLIHMQFLHYIILVPFYYSNASYTNLILGYSARIQCVNISLLDGVTIQWTNLDGNSIINNNTLVILNVTPSLHNTVYTCTAVVDTNSERCVAENKTIVLNVKGIVDFILSYCKCC